MKISERDIHAFSFHVDSEQSHLQPVSFFCFQTNKYILSQQHTKVTAVS